MRSEQHPRRSDQARRPLTPKERSRLYWLAVIGSALFIVVLWALLLPSQLSGSRSAEDADASPWRLIQDQPETASFRETLDQLRQRLDSFETSAVETGQVPPEYSDFSEKLKAASEKMINENSNETETP